MDGKLKADLFCSLLMARHIMTGSQIKRIMEEEDIPSVEAFYEEHKRFMDEEHISAEQKENWEKFTSSDAYLRIDEYVEYVSAREIRSINRLDPVYPEYMQCLPNMPLILYYRGDLSLLEKKRPRVCIVGTRRPSVYGRRVTRDFSKKISMHGVAVVSGMARGVDSCAHEECLSCGGKTIAVMPCGLDRIYPKENRELYERIAREGLLLSELLPGTEPIRQYFPARNRILAAISDAVVITEAGKLSGTLHTASFAAAQGREVFAVPSTIYSETAEGNLALLKDGATVATEPEDVLAFLAHVVFFREMEEIRDQCYQKQLKEKIESSPETITSSEIRKIIMDMLAVSGVSTDEMVKESGLPYRMLVCELGKMELEGIIAKDGNKYVLTIRV
ncbi:MAG: DNA-processing protein DprA [Clostridiales bacterium]|nr:DNA-processing protein DprA [Clostridiales bacterium]